MKGGVKIKKLLIVLVSLVMIQSSYAEIDWELFRDRVEGEFNQRIVDGLEQFLMGHPNNTTVYNLAYDLYQTAIKEPTIVEAKAEPATFDLQLSAGWNLISFPIMPLDLNASAVFSGIADSLVIVLSQDESWSSYVPGRAVNSLSEIDVKKGYWILMNRSDVLILNGTTIDSIEYNLKQGWNLIAYNSLLNQSHAHVFGLINESIIENFNYDGTWKKDSTIVTGRGYWIKVSENISLVFDDRFRAAYPGQMAALGDSITVAYNTEGLLSGAQPQHSWSTGYDATDIILSHWERLEATTPGDNRAFSGARMTNLTYQAQQAVAGNPEYITILMGSNDACRDSLPEMTELTVFEIQFRSAMDTLNTTDAQILVAGLPDIYQLYDVGIDRGGCTFLWSIASICRALTGSNAADRLVFRQRVLDYNEILERVASEYDQLYTSSVFDVQFTDADVAADCFHPSLEGQKRLANVTWIDGYYD